MLGGNVINKGVDAIVARLTFLSALATGHDKQIADHVATEGDVVNTAPDTTMGLLGFNPTNDDALLGRIITPTLTTFGVTSPVG